MSAGAVSHHKYPALRDLSPGAQAAAAWFRALARGIKTCRLYRPDSPVGQQVRQTLFEQLNGHVGSHGAWRIRITPIELWLVDEPIVHPTARTEDSPYPGKEEELPFLFYRDGVRNLTFLPEIPMSDFVAFFDALAATGVASVMHDDLVTLLWQANPVRIKFEAVPIHQTIYLSSQRGEEGGAGSGRSGLAYSWSPSGDEIHADLGQVLGSAQGLHLDTFDDWALPSTFVDVKAAYEKLARGMQFTRSLLASEWAAECGLEWTSEVPGTFRSVFAADPSPDTRAALAQSLVTWLASAVQSCAWEEAQQALTTLREFDPDGALGNEVLTAALANLDADGITERLDESEVADQSRFLALGVAMGAPALDLGVSLLGKAERVRTRAAASTLLCYLCADRPELLVPYLADSRWYVVRNAVFVLGQIGGHEVVELLEGAARHPEARVRRQVIHSLGNVPIEDRIPILAVQLQSTDLRLLAAALAMLARHKNRDAVRVLLRQIQAPDFESRSPEHQRMIFNTVADMADDEAVPALAELVLRGGWFARRSPQRSAAAQALARIGSEAAIGVLEKGIRTGNDAVRSACLSATGTKADS